MDRLSFRNAMIFAVVFLLLYGLGATILKAEGFVVFKHKAWEVTWNEEGYCSAAVYNQNYFFSIDADRDSVTGYVIDRSKDWAAQRNLLMFLQVDDETPWELKSVATNDQLLLFPIIGNQASLFLHEIMNGRELFFDYNERGTTPDVFDVRFPLAGSAAAIQALADCTDKL